MLLVDEISICRRHRYVRVLVNGDTGEVLAMVPHRNVQALSGFLAAQGHKWCKGVKVVVSDGSKTYKAATGARLGHARHVLDRFHVIRWFAAGLTAVRRDVQRRPEGSVPAFDPEVFRARFLLMRRPDTLDAAARARLETLFAACPRLKAAWDALGELHNLYLAETAKALSPPWTGSPTSIAPARSQSSATSSTPSSHGTPRSSTGNTQDGPATAASKEPTTSSRPCAAEPTASPTTQTSKPAASSSHNLTPPGPAALTPQKDEGSESMDWGRALERVYLGPTCCSQQHRLSLQIARPRLRP